MSTFFSGYKKLLVAVLGAVAVFLVPFVNGRYGMDLDPAEVAATLAGLVSVVLAYITAEFKLDKARATAPVNPAVLALIAGVIQFAPAEKRAELSKLLADLSA